MKVLYVSHTSLVSGAEGALLDLLAALPSGIDGLLACPEGPLAERARALSVEVLPLPPVSASFRLGLFETPTAAAQLLSAAIALRRVVGDHSPDVVHANTLRAGLVCTAARVAGRQPLVVHCHDVLPQTRQADLVRAVLDRAATAIVTISEYTAARFRRDRAKTPVEVFYNPLDVVRFDPARVTKAAARSSIGFGGDDQLLGLFAQITPWKGHELAVRALARLADQYPSLRLLIVGETKFMSRETRYDNPAFLDYLHELINELGLEERVEFWGERADVDVLMRAVDVALTPSWEEPFGRSVVEAMALETPVVATSVGGPAEFVEDGVDGLLAPPDDVSAWTAAIGSLLDSPHLSAELGRRAGLKVRARFDREAYVARVQALYERIAHQATPAFASGKKAKTAGDRDCRCRPRRLRVLFVEYSSVLGGGQHSLLELLRVLSRDHEIHLACPRGPLAELASRVGIEVVPIPESQLSFRLLSRVTLREAVRTLIARRCVRRERERIGPDVVHANSLRAGLLTSLARGRGAVVVHCRDLLPPGLAGDLVSGVILRSSSQVIAVSSAAKARLSGVARPSRNVTVIANPVNVARFDPKREDVARAKSALGITGGPVLGLIAQITPWKGHDRAVRVLDVLRRTEREAKLLIVGSTKFVTPSTRFDNVAYERGLKQLVHQLGLDDVVVFLGERADVELILAATDVLLVPSTEEPFGRTIIEAMAMEVPIVATNVGGPPEIIRWGLDGFFLPPDDVAAWANAAALLASRGARSESRRYAVERFNPERHAAAVLDVYASVLSDRHHG